MSCIMGELTMLLKLVLKPEGVYVDCTFGGGGHSKAILERFGEKGKLILFDQDEDARRNVPDDKRVLFIPHNFRHISRFLQLHGIKEVDGLLDAPDHRNCLTEVDLSVTGWMDQGNEHLLGAGALIAYIVLHDCVAAREAVLGPQAVIDALGGVALLGRRCPVRL